MAIKWAWGFSTDQSRTKLEGIGFTFGYLPLLDTAQTHTYTGDAVTKRASMRVYRTGSFTVTPGGLPNEGWVDVAQFRMTGDHFHASKTILYIWGGTGTSSIYVRTASQGPTPTVQLYINGVYKASSSATLTTGTWNWFAIRYEASTSTFAATVFLDGTEVISRQTAGGCTAWTDPDQIAIVCASLNGDNIPASGTWYSDIVVYDDITDAGQTEVWCSTMEPIGDHIDEAGSWTATGGGSNHSQVTPWNTATYTENTTPVAGTDQIVLTCPTISSHLGISPPVYAVVSQSVVSGGSDFQALVHVGGSYIAGTTVTSDANDPTYGFSTVATGLSASTVVRIGTKTP